MKVPCSITGNLLMVYVSCQVPNAYYQIQLPITETLPDGQQVTKTIMQIARRNVGHSINSQHYKVKKLDPPGFRLSTFLLGSHDDVDVAAVSIPAASINEETVEVLRRLRGLESVLLRVNKKYYACLLYTSPSPRDRTRSRMPSSA